MERRPIDELGDPFEPFRLWFRSLPRWAQWIVGPVIVVGGLWAFWSETTHVAQPDEPKKAIWVTLILLVVTIVLNELLRPKPNIEDARPAGLGDFQVPTATEGRVVPLIWGRVRQRGPNVVWYGDLQQEAITEKVKTGLWSSETFTKGFRYHLGIQFALCRGGGDGVVLKRVWIGDDEVFSGTISTNTFFDIDDLDLFGGDELGSGGVQATCDFYVGSNSQPVSAYLDTTDRQRIGTAATPTAPRYSGTCYVVARELTSAAPVSTNVGAYIGNSTTIKAWSFEIERYPGIFSGQAAGENKIGSVDANPVNVIYELLVNDEWGFGFPSSDIDVGLGSSFLSAADTMITEGNGFSMILDRQMKAKDLLQELQRQIDGVVFLDQRTGKWKIKLARDDYTIGTVPQLDDTNVAEVRDYTRGSWEDTTNTITVQYDKRTDDYKQSFALAQDMANAIIQGNGTVAGARATAAKVAFPGVKSSALASNLAWRELRGQSFPLARATLVVNREMWDLTIGDVVAWTNAKLGYVQLPMRITNVDYGRLEDNKMTITVVQDVFKFAAASMGTPPATGWTPPAVSLVAFPADEQLAIEAPQALLTRAPNYAGDINISKVFCAAARQGGEVAFDITQRNSSGTPGGTYADAGTVFSFMRIGALNAALPAGDQNDGATNITITPDASSQTQLETAFNDAATDQDLGQDLVHLILVNNEFMLVRDASISASNVLLSGVFRGVLDSVQGDHSSTDQVYLVFVGGGLSSTNFPTTNNVDVELRMRSASSRFAGSVTKVALTMAKRSIRPYPATALFYNNIGKTTANSFNTPNLEDATSGGENGYTFRTDWWRRILGPGDEFAATQGDIDPNTHPEVTNTQYQVRVFVDPAGSNTEIASSPFAWQAGTGTILVPRLEILDVAAAGTTVRVQIQTRHDIFTETNLVSRYTQTHDKVPTTVNSGLFYLGGNIGTGPSNAYVVAAAGVHVLDIGAAPSGGTAQYRINGGAWNNITAGGTSTASLSISDTIEVRYSAGSVTPDPNFVWIDNPSAVRVAYGCL